MARTRGNRVRQAHRSGRFERLEDRRLLTADWRNAVDALDVDADRFVVSLDALLVINDLNVAGPRPLPATKDPDAAFVDVDGDQFLAPLDALRVINYLNNGEGPQRLLTEGSSLARETQVVIGLGQDVGSRLYRVEIDARFDTGDQSAALEDLLAVYLVDERQPDHTILDRGQAGTTLFSLAGDRAEFAPGKVQWDGAVLQIDLTDLNPRAAGILKFQLISSDNDVGSRVTIRPLSNDVDPAGVSAPAFPAPALPSSSGGALNMTGLTTPANVKLAVENVRLDADTGRYAAELRLTNLGGDLGRGMAVSFPGLPAGVSLRNPSGFLPGGVPYLNVAPAVGSGGLRQGERSRAILVEFDDADLTPFSLKPQIAAGVNHAPTLASVPRLTTTPGDVLTVALTASDVDGDKLTYLLSDVSSLPNGRLSADGVLEFRTAPGQLGTYAFDVIVSDGALDARRTVTLDVVADPVVTTRVAGQVLLTTGQPLAGVRVEVGAVQGLTGADGKFLLDLGAGPVVTDTIKVRGELFAGTIALPFIAEKLPLVLAHDLYSGVKNVIGRPIYLPALDLANGKTIDPTRDNFVTSSALPGTELYVAAGTLLNQQGSPFTGTLSITQVPVALTPAALPEYVDPSLVVTIQPGEMAFAAPAPLTFPNNGKFAPGSLLDLLSINPVTGQFDDVGDMRVSADGRLIETISGGVRNSSWHFPAPPPPEIPPPGDDPDNPYDGCDECPKGTAAGNSEVELHSGAEIETHPLIGYQSQGIERQWVLTYDSLRADPRPIVHFGAVNTLAFPDLKLVAGMTITNRVFTYQVPGYDGGQYGLRDGDHIWSVSTNSPDTQVALQADMRSLPTGRYAAEVRAGLKRFDGAAFTGSTSTQSLDLLHVNSIASQFGAGWGLAGLQELTENPDGSILLIDGDGSENLFEPPAGAGQPYQSPPGSFSTLTRLADQTFRLTTKDATVYTFNGDNRLARIADRNGNATVFTYDAQGRLTRITDPVGLETVFAIDASGRVQSVTDPAGRVTQFQYDAAGNLTRVTDPDGSFRTWQYDAEHHMTGEIDQRGLQESTVYDFAGRVVQAVMPDGAVRQYAPRQTANLLAPEATIQPLTPPVASGRGAGLAAVADELGRVTTYQLDRAGQIVAAFDAEGRLPRELRDDRNLVTQRTDGRGHVTTYAHDSRGNVIAIRDEGSGGSVLGGITTVGETDVYTFLGAPGQRIFYDALNNHPGDLRTTITSPTGNLLLNRDLANADHGPFTLTESGEYRVTITGNNDATGIYEFRLYDAVESRQLASLDADISGSIHLPGARDVYTFTPTVGQSLFYDALSNPAGDIRVSLVSPSGVRLVNGAFRRDDQGPFTITETGPYSLIFEGSGDDIGDYHFRLATPTATSTPLALDAITSGSILEPGERNSYTFGATAGQRIFYDALSDPTGDVRATLISPTGARLFEDVYRRDDQGPYVLGESGTYQLLFRGVGDDTGDYRFQVVTSTSTTQPVTLDVDTSGAVSRSGEEDVFTFTAAAGQRIFYDSLSNPAGDVRVTLISPLGTRLINGSFRRDDAGPFTLSESGEYRLIFNGAGDDAGDYRFRIATSSVSTAPLALDTTTSGSIAQTGALDAYTFHGMAGQRIFYDSLTNPAGDVRVTLVSPSGVRLISNSFRRDDQGPFTLTETGTYQLQFAGSGDDIGDYSFQLVTSTVATTPLSLNMLTSSVVSRPGETDIYTFTGTVGQQVYYDASSNAAGDLRATLISPTGTRLFSGVFVDTDQGPFVLTEAGTYQLAITGAGDDTGAYDYQLLDPAARVLTVGTTETGTLDPGMGSRAWRIAATKGQRLQFTSLAGGNASWTLFGPSGNSFGSQNIGTSFVETIPSNGNYLLLLDGSAGTPLPYNFQVTDVSDVPVTPSGLGALHSGTLAAGEQHQFTYQIEAGTRFIFDSQGTPAAGLRAILRDPLNQQVWITDDMSDRGAEVAARSGAYSLTVEGDTASSTGSYRFVLADIRGNATEVTLSSAITGSITASREVDLYGFDGAAGQRIDYNTLSAITADLRLDLISPSGNFLYNFMYMPTDDFAFHLPETGRYQVLVYGNGASTGNYSFEFSASTVTTTAATLGAPLTGNISVPGELDIYTFSANAGQRVIYDTQSSSGPDLRMNLVSPSGTLLYNFHYLPYDDSGFQLPETGVYQVLVYGNRTTTGAYDFRFVDAPVNSTASTLGATWSGEINPPGEVDIYRFTAAAGQRVGLDTQAFSGGDIRMNLVSPTGELVYNFYYLQYEDFGFFLKESGEYQVVVYGNLTNTGPYNFRLVPAVVTTASASLGTPLTGSIDSPGEVDVYTFTANAGQRVDLDTQITSGGDVRMNLVSPTGDLIYNFRDLHFDDNGFFLNETGEYQVVVYGNLANTGAYNFRFVPASVTTNSAPLGTPMTGEITVSGEVDVFSFAGTIGQRAGLDTQITNGGDVRLTLVSPSGRRIYNNRDLHFDDQGFYLDETGTYQALVYGNAAATGQYDFRLAPSTFSSATVSLGTNVAGTISTPGQLNEFTFSAEAGERVLFDTRVTSGGDVRVTLLSPSGTPLSGFSFRDSHFDSGPFALPETGVYRLEVSGNGAATGAFDFRFVDLTNADFLAFDQDVAATLDPGASVAAYRFLGTAGQRLYFDDRNAASTNGTWTLYRSGNQQVANSGLDSDFVAILPEDDTYVLVLSGASATAISPQFQVVSTNTTPVPLAFDQITAGQIAKPGEQDVYTFAGAVGQTLFFDALENEFDNVQYQVIAPSGRILKQQNTDTEERQPFTLSEVGAHRLLVFAGGDLQADYRFRLLNASAADVITLGMSNGGTLDPGRRSDVFRLDGVAGQRVRFDFTTGGNYDWQLSGPDDQCVSCDVPPGMNLVVNLPNPGPYTLALRGLSNAAPVSYAFTVTDVTPAPVSNSGFGVRHTGTVTGTPIDFPYMATAGTLVYVDALGTSASGATFQFRDGAGQVVFSGNQTTDSGPFVLPSSGNYTLRISGSGNYDVRLLTTAEASPLMVNLLRNATLATPYQTDLYRFQGVAGQRLYLDMAGDSVGGDVAARLITPGGTSLFDGTSIVGFGPFTLTRSGTYHLAMGRQAQTGNYSFRLVDATAAPTIPFNTPINDAVNGGREADLFRFDGAAGQVLRIASTSPVFSARARLFGSGNEPLDTVIVGTSDVITIPYDGTYTWVIDNDGAAFTQSYTFQMSEQVATTRPILRTTVIPTAPGERQFTYDSVFNKLTEAVDELGRRTLYEVDSNNGNLLSVTHVMGTLGGGDDLTTTMTYTAHGLVDTEVDPLGRMTDFDYDAFDRLIRIRSAVGTPDQGIVQFEYDAAGNRTARIDENGRRTEFQFDALNRLIRLTEPDPDGAGPLARPVTQYFYDALGNPVRLVDARGHDWRAEYDSRNRLVKSIDPNGQEHASQYDEAGNRIASIDPLGQSTRYEFDSRDRLVRAIDPSDGVTEYAYDTGDLLVSLVDPSGNVAHYEYDARGRLIERTDTLRSTARFEWNPVDELVATTDRLGRRVEFSYDDAHRRIGETWINGANAITNAYDKAGNLVSVADAFSAYVMTYDARDRVTSVDNLGTPDSPHVVLAYAYDAVGNRLTTTDTIGGAAGGVNSYVYDALNRPTRVMQSGAQVANKRVDSTYNQLGQFSTIERFRDLAGTQPVVATTYAYDSLNRLTGLHHRNAANADVAFYDLIYDADSRITRITSSDGIATYQYDNSDRLSTADYAAAGIADETYSYDPNGNRVSSSRHGSAYVTGANNRLLSDGIFEYAYDAEGNVVRRMETATGKVREFQWDYRNRLVRITDKSSSGVEVQRTDFTYDAFDRRIQLATDTTSPITGADAVVQHFAYDGNEVLLDFVDQDGAGANPTVLKHRYLHGPAVDQVLAQDDGAGAVFWQLSDHLATVRDLVDSNGAVAKHMMYDSYGVLSADSNPAIASRYRFAGREYDGETGLYYLRARYYDASLGTFLSEDPIGVAGGETNAYAYAAGDPIAYRDWSGHSRFWAEVGWKPMPGPLGIEAGHGALILHDPVTGETYAFEGGPSGSPLWSDLEGRGTGQPLTPDQLKRLDEKFPKDKRKRLPCPGDMDLDEALERLKNRIQEINRKHVPYWVVPELVPWGVSNDGGNSNSLLTDLIRTLHGTAPDSTSGLLAPGYKGDVFRENPFASYHKQPFGFVIK